MKKIFALATFILLPSMVSAATLSVSPSSKSVNVGDTLSVTINLDTQGSSIDGVDLRYLNYNPALLQVQDANTATAGIQISPGSLMSATLLNNVNNSLGKIAFSQVTAGGSKYKGSGVLATISFKALARGNASLTFDYAPSKTTDCNIAAKGVDILSAVINGSYAIGGSSAKSNTTVPPVPSNVSPTNNTGNITPSVPQNNTDTPVTGTDQPTTTTTQPRSFLGSLIDILNNIILRVKNGFLKVF